MSFRAEKKVNYYDCDGSNLLKISAAMRYMQQTSSEHLEALDMSPAKLYEGNMVFLLTKMTIKAHRMPESTEPIIVGTQAVEIKGVRFVREFTIDSPGGERLISALSQWVLADPKSHKILRPSSFPYELPLGGSILSGGVADQQIPKEAGDTKRLRDQILVRYSHLDLNRHVNNCVYADFVCDSLPYEQLIARGIDTLAIHFQNEAKWGEVLSITTSVLSDREYHLSARHGDGAACFGAHILLGELKH